jgi:hypothetical protein
MKKQLLSWAPNQTYDNLLSRLAFTGKGTLVAASVWNDDDGAFHASILNLDGPGDAMITKDNFKTIEEAKAFADQELKRQGYNF